MKTPGSRFRQFAASLGYRLVALGAGFQLGCGGSMAIVDEDEVAAGKASSSSASKPSKVTEGSGASDSGGGPGSSRNVGGVGAGATTGGAEAPGPVTGVAGAPPVVEPTRYPGKGFVVHEWGTDTIVVGSDGSLQRGLHHEEEDLPGFVYDRLKAGPSSPLSVTIKMETPVTYFYSDVPLTVQTSVSFPKGLLTQWFPAVSSFLPQIAAPDATVPGSPLGYADPVLDVRFPFKTDMCREKFSAIAGGKLNWGTLSVLPRGKDVSAMLPEAPLDEFSWSYARDVDANPIQTAGGESERFLFYRGLGDFDLPVTVQAGKGRHLALTNGYSQPIGRVFLLNVGDKSAAFTQHWAGIAPGATLTDVAPSLDGAASLDDYEHELSDAVTQALDATGLYHDEAMAMVNTWKRQWFRTPGVRALYLIPQAWTDASIPLTVTPAPESLLRVMLIRVEIITPEHEASDVAALKVFSTDTVASMEHFSALGRFAEPRLRRALALSPNPDAQSYLSKIQTANTAVAAGE
jgi:hypothetical protein